MEIVQRIVSGVIIGGFIGLIVGVASSCVSIQMVGGLNLGDFIGTFVSVAWCALLGLFAGMTGRRYAHWLVAGFAFAGQAIAFGYYGLLNNADLSAASGFGFIFAWRGGLLGLLVALFMRWGRPDIQNPNWMLHRE